MLELAISVAVVVVLALAVGATVLGLRARRSRPAVSLFPDTYRPAGNVRILRDADEVREAALHACERERLLAEYSRRRAEHFECLAGPRSETAATDEVRPSVPSQYAPPLSV